MNSNEYDLTKAQKRFKQLQLGVFTRKNSAFLAPLLCSLKAEFPDPDGLPEKKATEWIMGVDGETLYINPFTINLIPFNDGVFILEHELWHLARLHHQRQGKRDPEIWNYACDHAINLAMLDDGSTCSVPGLADPKYRGMSEEEIYADLIKDQQDKDKVKVSGNGNDKSPNGENNPNQQDSDGNQNEDNNNSGNQSDANNSNNSNYSPCNSSDLIPASEKQLTQSLNNVIKAKQQAQMSDGLEAGTMAGNLMKLWNKLLSPKLPWETILRNLMKDIIPKNKLSWKRRNRRFAHIHLPSMVPASKRLSHLVYAIDTSGSVDDEQLARINSEIKYIHDHVKPKKLTVIQFDHKLQHVDVFSDKDLYEKIALHGGGGTSYEPVKKFVDDLPDRPEGLVIFTDLYCKPMQPLKDESIPVFWVAVNTKLTANIIPFGEYIPVEV